MATRRIRSLLLVVISFVAAEASGWTQPDNLTILNQCSAALLPMQSLEQVMSVSGPQYPGPRAAPVLLVASRQGATIGAMDVPSGSATRHFLYSPELNLIAETTLAESSQTPTVAYEYIWFAGLPVAQIDVASGATHWTFTDHLGTPILQTNAAGVIDWRAELDPYGQVLTLRSTTDRHQPLRLPGQEAEQFDVGANGATQRSYNIYRWYRPTSGRYSQSEPRGLEISTNLYRYSDPNPIVSFDPDGSAPTQPQQAGINCKNDPCANLTVHSQNGAFSNMNPTPCSLPCWQFVRNQGSAPRRGSRKNSKGWSPTPNVPLPAAQGGVIMYDPSGQGWGGSGHGGLYDPNSGCAASCTKGDPFGGPPAPAARVLVHHPLCPPKGSPTITPPPPQYWFPPHK